jgi:hypothetical protein
MEGANAMSTAIRNHYTAEEYAAAKEVNAAAFLISIGYELKRSGNFQYVKRIDTFAVCNGKKTCELLLYLN